MCSVQSGLRGLVDIGVSGEEKDLAFVRISQTELYK
jgi:hypothetical protein